MQSTDRERFIKLKRELPFNYAAVLFLRYAKKDKKYSKSLIYKVANGERVNVIVFNDLLRLANEHQAFLRRYKRFDKRLNNK